MDPATSIPDLKSDSRKRAKLWAAIGFLFVAAAIVGIVLTSGGNDSEQSASAAKPAKKQGPTDYERWGDAALAVQRWSKETEEQPCNTESSNELFQAYRRGNDPTMMKAEVARFVRECKSVEADTDYMALLEGGYAAEMRDGTVDKAKLYADLIIENFPDTQYSYERRAEAVFLQGNNDQAEADMRSAIHIARTQKRSLSGASIERLAGVYHEEVCDAAFALRFGGKISQWGFDDLSDELYVEGKCKAFEGTGSDEFTLADPVDGGLGESKVAWSLDASAPFVLVPGEVAGGNVFDQSEESVTVRYKDTTLSGKLGFAEIKVGKLTAKDVRVLVVTGLETPVVGQPFFERFYLTTQTGDTVRVVGS